MFALTGRKRIIILILVDSLLLIAANSAAVNLMEPFVAIPIDFTLISSGLSIVFYLLHGSFFKVFTRINRHANLREVIVIFGSLSTSTTSSIIVLLFVNK